MVWDNSFRNLFLEFCVPSLLAPGNIPALDEQIRAASQFLICTTTADAIAIAEHPAYTALTEQISVEFIDLGKRTSDSDRYQLMSHGHLVISRLMFDNHAYGVFLCPDAILSDGAVAHIA